MSDYPYNAGNMTMTIPVAKFADLHDKIKSRDAENALLKAEVYAIRKELAEAQENYHLVNEMVAKMLKAGKSIE
jgi:hypothetical protein